MTTSAKKKAEREKQRALFHLQLDSLTQRDICFNCWNRRHGTEQRPWCDNGMCQCLCKDAKAEAQAAQERRLIAGRERRALEQAMLEDEANPLRAVKGAASLRGVS